MDENDLFSLAIYVALFVGSWGVYAILRSQRTWQNLAKRKLAHSAGLGEPSSLHPIVDPARCIGCGSCVDACPEKKVLGLIYGRAGLLNAAMCIGHGACKEVCPTGAISLVFGTATRGVDIPLVKPNFETNVPGVYIAGELGGMGLIRNAMTQGVQAIDGMMAELKSATGNVPYDVIIVGSGPAGIAAALTAKKYNLRYLVVEQESLGGAIFQYPRGKLVMTSPVELPLVGGLHFRQTTKEELLEFFTKMNEKYPLNVHYHQRVEKIEGQKGDFILTTNQQSYHTRCVLLAIGRRGTPRKLDVEGEELPKVVYRLMDPEQYVDHRVLVVGGGDSAIEAACAIAELGNHEVTLSYRREVFSRIKQGNRDRLELCQAKKGLRLLLNSEVIRIHSDRVELRQGDEPLEIENDAVIVCAGGVLPTDFLRTIGIEVQTKYGTL
ncbi:MAG: NAD(P)-binding domain-containing protein [Gammaproteobacteria bacterium]|nr:NAD(P)-binding domain-containing protein [Gammaproteobacteria bacterium]